MVLINTNKLDGKVAKLLFYKWPDFSLTTDFHSVSNSLVQLFFFFVGGKRVEFSWRIRLWLLLLIKVIQVNPRLSLCGSQNYAEQLHLLALHPCLELRFLRSLL